MSIHNLLLFKVGKRIIIIISKKNSGHVMETSFVCLMQRSKEGTSAEGCPWSVFVERDNRGKKNRVNLEKKLNNTTYNLKFLIKVCQILGNY